jgi:hypothetical protein
MGNDENNGDISMPQSPPRPARMYRRLSGTPLLAAKLEKPFPIKDEKTLKKFNELIDKFPPIPQHEPKTASTNSNKAGWGSFRLFGFGGK